MPDDDREHFGDLSREMDRGVVSYLAKTDRLVLDLDRLA
jgi:hypothetical protein